MNFHALEVRICLQINKCYTHAIGIAPVN